MNKILFVIFFLICSFSSYSQDKKQVSIGKTYPWNGKEIPKKQWRDSVILEVKRINDSINLIKINNPKNKIN